MQPLSQHTHGDYSSLESNDPSLRRSNKFSRSSAMGWYTAQPSVAKQQLVYPLNAAKASSTDVVPVYSTVQKSGHPFYLFLFLNVVRNNYLIKSALLN